MARSRQFWLYLLSGIALFLGWLVAGGVWEPTDQLLGVGPWAFAGAALFAWAHVP